MNPPWPFYPGGVDLPTQGIVGTTFEDGAMVFFTMNDGLILALYPGVALANDAREPIGARSPTELFIDHVVTDDA